MVVLSHKFSARFSFHSLKFMSVLHRHCFRACISQICRLISFAIRHFVLPVFLTRLKLFAAQHKNWPLIPNRQCLLLQSYIKQLATQWKKKQIVAGIFRLNFDTIFSSVVYKIIIKFLVRSRNCILLLKILNLCRCYNQAHNFGFV